MLPPTPRTPQLRKRRRRHTCTSCGSPCSSSQTSGSAVKTTGPAARTADPPSPPPSAVGLPAAVRGLPSGFSASPSCCLAMRRARASPTVKRLNQGGRVVGSTWLRVTGLELIEQVEQLHALARIRRRVVRTVFAIDAEQPLCHVVLCKLGPGLVLLVPHAAGKRAAVSRCTPHKRGSEHSSAVLCAGPCMNGDQSGSCAPGAVRRAGTLSGCGAVAVLGGPKEAR